MAQCDKCGAELDRSTIIKARFNFFAKYGEYPTHQNSNMICRECSEKNTNRITGNDIAVCLECGVVYHPQRGEKCDCE